MDAPRAPCCLLLLLAGILLHGWPCEGVPSLYTIDQVRLSVLPRPAVASGTNVTLRCTALVSVSGSRRALPMVFRFLRQDTVVHTVNTTHNEALYQLHPARAGDSGAYECRLQVEEKVKASLGQTLTVTGLQTPEFQLSTSELYESEELEATCAVPQEKGMILFKFFQQQRLPGAGGEVAEVTLLKQVPSTDNRLQTKLQLRDVGDWEMFCNYSMPMLPDEGSSNSSNRIQVLVKGLFISPVMSVVPQGKVVEGDVVEVVCEVVNPPKGVAVYLTKDRHVLKQASVSLIHRFKVGVGQGGEYVCKAEYGPTQKETYQTITVKELFSRPQLTLETPDVFEGELLQITCFIDFYSPERLSNENIHYSFWHNGKPLPPLPVGSEATYKAVARTSQNGNYSCQAMANTARSGEVVKESPTLVIKAKVPVSQPVLSVVGGRLVLGKPFSMRCHSDNGSLPITYTLHGPRRNQQVLEVRGGPGGEQAAIFNTSALQKADDLHLFFCNANNHKLNAPRVSLGLKLLSTTEIIEPVSRPVLSLNPDPKHVSEGQDLTLLCTVPRGTPPINLTWYHSERPQSPLDFQISPGSQGSYTIASVGRAHSGGYYCECSNAAGDIKKSSTVVVGIKMAGWKKGLIIVICILLLMAVVLAIMFKKGLLRGRRNRKELSVKSASTHTECLSLTKAEADDTVNVTPGVMGRSVWSEHVSGSDTDEQNSMAAPEESQPTVYTEVRAGPPDPSRVKTPGTDAVVYSEVRNSKQGVSEETADGGSVEYAQLNNDSAHRNSAHRNSAHRNSAHRNSAQRNSNSGGVQPDNIDDIDELNNTETTTAVHDDYPQAPPAPDC